jgi:hypothetical protein
MTTAMGGCSGCLARGKDEDYCGEHACGDIAETCTRDARPNVTGKNSACG